MNRCQATRQSSPILIGPLRRILRQRVAGPWLLLLGLLSACVTDPKDEPLPPLGPLRCDYFIKRVHEKDAIAVLDRISDLFDSGCYRETISLGSKARESFRYKNYSILRESAELFLAEGSVTDYVLESYERGYLSFLILLSYLKLQDDKAVTVELNRFYQEEVASLYNYGQDPVNALLQATLWENHPTEGFSARPFWLWLSKAESAAPELRGFAAARLQDFDAKKRSTWHATALGRFPSLDWSMTFADSKSGYFKIKALPGFAPACADADSMLLPTSSWFAKIAMRHSHAYHPLVNAKSWIRLPIGLIYGISTATAGAGLMIGGCALDLSSKGDGSLCKVSIQGGAAIMASSDEIVDYALKPDLRHWQKVPAALLIYRSSTSGSRCQDPANSQDARPLF